MGWENDKAWSDRFIPDIKAIVGPRLLVVAPLELDAKEATDLLVFTARDFRVAARVRSQNYLDRYPNDFTIRSRRDSGAVTEMAKIIDGWGDWMFYGFGDGASNIAAWRIFDLKVFRREFCRAGWQGRSIPFKQLPNGDGTHFLVFDHRDFPEDFVVDSGRFVARTDLVKSGGHRAAK